MCLDHNNREWGAFMIGEINITENEIVICGGYSFEWLSSTNMCVVHTASTTALDFEICYVMLCLNTILVTKVLLLYYCFS